MNTEQVTKQKWQSFVLGVWLGLDHLQGGASPGKMAGEIVFVTFQLSLESLLPSIPGCTCCPGRWIQMITLIKMAMCFLYVQCSSPPWELEPLLAKAARTWTESMCIWWVRLLPCAWGVAPLKDLTICSMRQWCSFHVRKASFLILLVYMSPQKYYILSPLFPLDNPGDVWRQPLEVSWILPHLPPASLSGFLPQAKHAHLLPTLLLRCGLSSFTCPWCCPGCAFLLGVTIPHVVCPGQGGVVAHMLLAMNASWLHSHSGSASHWLWLWENYDSSLCLVSLSMK